MKTIIQIITLSLLTLSLNAQVNIAGNTLDYTGENTVDFGQVDFQFTNEMTIMFWVKWSIDPATGNSWANIVTMNSEDHGDSGQFWLQHNSNNSKFEFALATLGNNDHMSRTHMFSNTSPVKDVWYHVAVTYDGSKMKIYVNGVLEKSQNKTGNIYPYQDDFILTIASWAAYDYARTFVGQVDELSIWNIAKTEEEINIIMNQLLDGDEENLVAYYRFDQLDGNVVEDLSGNSVNGTNVGIDGAEPAALVNSTAPIYSLLPIELISFEAELYNDNVELFWETASEINNDYFTIYRSVDGKVWSEIGTVDGSGNSNENNVYSFVDYSPVGAQIYYKLKQTDFDGRFEEFDVVLVEGNFTEIEFSTYPNPAIDFVNIKFDSNQEIENLNVMVFNSFGQNIISQNINSTNLNNASIIDVSELKAGTYFIKILDNNQEVYNTEIMVVR